MRYAGSVTYRLLSGEDVAGVHALDQRCFAAGIAYTAEEIAAYLRMPGLHQGCERDGRLIAVLLSTMAKAKTRGHIITVDVAPEARRRGIGQELMRRAEAYYRAHGAPGMRLEAAVNNAGALAFYARLGYQMKGLLPGYYAADLDALRLELDF